MIEHAQHHLLRLLKIDFVRFCIVGGTGFVINFVILVVLHKGLGVAVFLAQLIAAEIALFSNFMMHHHWTYKSHNVQKSLSRLVIQFHATTWPAIIGSALMVTAGEKLLHLSNLLALALSSAIALFWNFFWSKFIIWRHTSTKEIEEVVS